MSERRQRVGGGTGRRGSGQGKPRKNLDFFPLTACCLDQHKRQEERGVSAGSRAVSIHAQYAAMGKNGNRVQSVISRVSKVKLEGLHTGQGKNHARISSRTSDPPVYLSISMEKQKRENSQPRKIR